MSDKEDNVAEFNMAVSYLNRINMQLWKANEAMANLDACSWWQSLNAVYVELSPEFNDKEEAIARDYRVRLAPMVEAHNKQFIYNRNKGKIEIKAELYDTMQEFDIFLRKVLKRTGFQMKYQQSASRAL